ncbi:hypothetical protein [Nocardioides daphniae]|nr:hypothetical protein [Nocardioides daphniae]
MVTYETTDDVLTRIDAQTRAAEAEMIRAREFHAALGTLRGHGSATGVAVEVDSAGLLTGLCFAPHAAPPPGDSLARAVMSALRVAQVDALSQVQAHAERVWGSDPLVARIMTEAGERLGVETAPGGGR